MYFGVKCQSSSAGQQTPNWCVNTQANESTEREERQSSFVRTQLLPLVINEDKNKQIELKEAVCEEVECILMLCVLI